MNIALEEHFIVPCLADYLEKAMPKVSPTAHDKLLAELADFGEMRIAAMDAGGVSLAVLSISGPGVQVEPDAAVAIKLAQQANDLLATEVHRRRDRYAGFAHLAMQDPAAAADELERSVRDLGFVGAIVKATPMASTSTIHDTSHSGNACRRSTSRFISIPPTAMCCHSS
jgi:2,3-dihydroxybenzoate decarboxylase